MGRRAGAAFAVWAMAALAPTPASAELVFLTTGRSISVKAHRVEGGDIVLLLRGGGEVTCPAGMVERIAPDEVPYMEPGLPPGASRAAAALGFEVPPEYAGMIERAAATHGVDPALIKALIHIESRYQPRARSPRGAMGLMQLMPATARDLSVNDPYDPEMNIDGGVRHLRSLLDRFDIPLALAAYNAGQSAVEQHQGIPPYPETRAYVRNVMRLAGLSERD
ncbi:MAG: lytic transglycosylase domain-containing protein [Vicinamibacterales bacterium]